MLKTPERLTIRTIYRRYVHQFMLLVSAILGLSFLAKLVSLVLPRYLGAIVDLALAGDGAAIRRTVLMIGVLFLASSLISILETYLSNYVLN